MNMRDIAIYSNFMEICIVGVRRALEAGLRLKYQGSEQEADLSGLGNDTRFDKAHMWATLGARFVQLAPRHGFDLYRAFMLAGLC